MQQINDIVRSGCFYQFKRISFLCRKEIIILSAPLNRRRGVGEWKVKMDKWMEGVDGWSSRSEWCG